MLQSVVQPLVRRVTDKGSKTLIQRAIASLRARGTDAHLWLPGVGSVNGLTTGNYLESTGNTLATVDNPVGLVLDALGSVGSELVTNGTFGTDTGWTKGVGCSIAGGKAVFTEATGYFGQVIALGIPSTFLEFTVVVDSLTSGILSVETDGAIGNDFSITSAGKYTFRRKHTGAGNIFYINSKADPLTAVISSVSLKPVSGIHLTQTTTANKPLLRRGLTNLLTYSSDFSNAAWTKSSLTVTGSQADPNGGSSAYKLTPAALAEQHAASSTNVSAGTYTWAVIAKNTGYNLGISCYDGAYKVGSIFNLSSGTVTVSAAGSVSEILPLGAGWYLCTVTATLTASSSFGGFAVRPNIAGVSISEAVVGDGVSSVTVYRAGLFIGTLTASQILAAGGIPVTTTAAASNPNAGKYSWAFDGSNDRLELGSVPFQMGDDFAVVCAVEHDAPAGWATMFAVTGATATPRIQMFLNNDTGAFGAYLRDDSGEFLFPSGVADLRGSKAVLTMCKRGTAVYLRVNKVQIATASTASLGVATLTVAAIGFHPSQGGDYMRGRLYFLTANKGTFQDADLALEESLAASAAGITI